jgi:dipeptidyl aminopeptidase/acylaminoacyl peptidase
MVNLRVIAASLLAVLWMGTAFAASAPKRGPEHEDIWLMKRVGAPKPSPDARWIVATVLDPAYDENAQYSDLWLIDATGSVPSRRLTSTRRAEAGVSWSPDSRRLVFSSQREDDAVPQIYLLDLSTPGDARRITEISGGARTPMFSPDGKHIAFTTLVYPDAADEAANKARIEERRKRKWNARIYDGFPIRNWDRWLDERQTHLAVVDLDEQGLVVGEPRNLLRGTRLAASRGFAGRQTDTSEELDSEFTPDSRALVFAATTNRDAAAYSFTDSQLFKVDIAGGEPVQLTRGGDGWASPRFTPDGQTLLALLERRSEFVYTATRLMAFTWPEVAEPRAVTEDFDRSVGSFAVTPDSRTIYFTAEDSGSEKLYSVRTSGGKPVTRFGVGRGSYSSVAIPEKATRLRVFATWESAASPAEIASIDPTSGATVSLSKFNAARVAQLDLPSVENFWFTSSRGKRIHSLVVRPPGFDSTKKYPLFVLIHGGPHSMWRDQFFIRWNYHLIASPGYVLLLTNYSGSTGFGEAFAQSIQGDPLKGPGDEVNEAADAAIKRYSFIDGGRQCAGGASYGGHLSNWLQASTTRYRCLVSHAGLVNLEAQWGTSDTIYSREVNMGGPPWEQGAVWREQNPIRYASKFKTPVLVTVGENDFRVPLNNTLEYWSALQRMRVPSRLIVFPDENHWILKGEDSRLFYSELEGWLGRWLTPPPPAAAANAGTPARLE